MTDAPRLTDERIRRLAYGDLPRVNEVRSMADELQERRAQQGEGAQAKVVEAAARRIVDALKSPASLMGGETAILNTKDVGLVARALLTQAERGREEWQPIESAPKETGREILGLRASGGRVIREPFISFWSPTLNKFYCDPTHYIPMPALKRSGQESGEKKDG